jgi:hypothetical protein
LTHEEKEDFWLLRSDVENRLLKRKDTYVDDIVPQIFRDRESQILFKPLILSSCPRVT